jgi:NAD-dependent deacetylase
MKKRIVVFTGAGISAESGIKTFRDSDGLWENYRIEDVATPEAWRKDPKLVLDFYNQRRKQSLNAKPNLAHFALVKLEEKFDVRIITQNVDDLHERAGSSNVIHLHGQLNKSRSSLNPKLIYDIEGEGLSLGDLAEDNSQLRPHIVWFGENVPAMDDAMYITQTANVFIVIGTSLAVYPAASLVDYAISADKKILVDPKAELPYHVDDFELIRSNAGEGVPKVVKQLLENQF